MVRLLYAAPMPSILAKPFGNLMLQAGVDLLPDWASDLLGERQAAWRRPLIRASVQRTANPVSYTHLDVYKRQPRHCAPSPSAACAATTWPISMAANSAN